MIVLDPYWYVLTTEMGTVGGWGFGYPITIAFPGVPVNDFSVDIEYEALLSGKDGVDLAIATATLGEDVTEAVIAIAPGEDPNAAFALILAEDESVITVTESGEVKIPLPEEVAEAYSIVIVPVVDGEILPEEAAYDVFAYKDFSLEVIAATPTINDDETTGTVDVSFVFGDDVEYAKVAIFEGKAADLTDEDLAIFDDEDSEDYFLIKHSDDEVSFHLPEEGDYTIVGVSYALEQAWNTASTELEFVLVDPWILLGEGVLTDDVACGIYDISPNISVPCTVYEHSEFPGFYKIMDFQLPLVAAAFGASEELLADYEGVYWRNSPLKIDATDPENVFIELQDYGVCLNPDDGFIDGITSLYNGEPFSVGLLADGVISFPTAKGMLATINGEGYYYANQNGAFQVVLPAAAPSAPAKAPAKASVSMNGRPEKANLKASYQAVSISRGRIAQKSSKEFKQISL